MSNAIENSSEAGAHREGCLSDQQLVEGIRRRAPGALAEAHRRHGAAVMGVAHRVVRDHGLAEDVTQDVFLRLWRSPSDFQPERGTLRSYLSVLAHGRSIDLVRSEEARRRREVRHGRDTHRVAGHRPTGDGDARVDRLDEALALLSPKQRAAVDLAFFSGHTYREVAVLLDLPEGTIKGRLRQSLVVLRERLSIPDGPDDR